MADDPIAIWLLLSTPDLVCDPVKGIDSAVWRFTRENLILEIDFGLYSGKPAVDKEERNYVEKSAIINGKKATLVSFEPKNWRPEKFKYVDAVYFPKVGKNGMKLYLSLVQYFTGQKSRNKIISFNSTQKMMADRSQLEIPEDPKSGHL